MELELDVQVASDPRVLAAEVFSPETTALRSKLAIALALRAEEVVEVVWRATDRAELAPSDPELLSAIVAEQAALVRRGVELVARWVAGGNLPANDELIEVGATGHAAASSGLPFARLVVGHLAWRDALRRVLAEEMTKAGARSALKVALVVNDGIDRSCDRVLRRIAAEFDAAQRRIFEQLDSRDQQLSHLARHDSLTSLANRHAGFDRLAEALRGLRRGPAGHAVVVVFVDLDGFKEINDRFGHRVGDQVLGVLGQRLAASMRPGDMVCRFGGDEFVVICEQASDTAGASAVAKRILEALRQPVAAGELRLTVTASCGVVVARDPEADPDQLIHQADTAMYVVKARGGNDIELAV